ncbi:MAG: ABC transporter substrate-binding protein [Dehalococcoidia bacterium]
MRRRVIAPAAKQGGERGAPGWSRRLLLLVIATLIAMPVAHAGASRVTIVTSRDIAPYRLAREGFLEVLEASGVDYRVEEVQIDSSARGAKKVVQAIRGTRPDVILTIGSAATRAVGDEIHDIPIIFSLVLEGGGDESSEQFGPNVTGASMHIPLRTQFEKLQEAIPTAQRFGVMYNPDETGDVVDEAARVAQEMGLELIRAPVRNPADVLAELEGLEGRVDLLWSVADSTVFTPQSVRHILLSTLRKKIPFIGLSPSYVRAGALLSLSCDYRDVGRQSGDLALEILGGSAPGQVPVTMPRRVSFYLNLNTASQLEIEISERIRDSAEVVSGS